MEEVGPYFGRTGGRIDRERGLLLQLIVELLRANSSRENDLSLLSASKRYIMLTLKKGGAFVDFAHKPKDGELPRLRVALQCRQQRFFSRVVEASLEPEFEDTFFIRIEVKARVC